MSSNSAGPIHVAVIEDDPAVLDSLMFALGAEGHDVHAFKRAQDALDSPQIMQSDCLVIDYALPDFDGLTMLGRLRRRGLNCPAIIIAGNVTAHCRAEALAARAPILEKPITGAELSNLLHAVLGR